MMILTAPAPAPVPALTVGQAAVGVFACPGNPTTCKRPPGSRCVNSSGKPCAVHIQRWRLGEGYVRGYADRAAR